MLLQVVSNLMVRSPYPCNLIGSHYNESETVPLHDESHRFLVIFYTNFQTYCYDFEVNLMLHL
ncbi:hypothetical protein H6G72_26675 [Planktothricoides sp. FACHB-1370]|uniref:Uncharacterized protein n=2 Tax=Planktothricoides raciborskii TaxID=132608 RepID=A0AAU8JEM3_9CYAN|nr:hypothetical protein [Planktothricoides raciborskii]MBD2547349.1 hypothetical protein [Planktothricoides raciborskii FACHB-1370]MBD2585848.1 hypothetical protein [Planktothricoides raciborskii FACHB-1261]